MTSFQALGLSDELLRAAQALDFLTPTPIQARAIPAVLAGGDVCAEAQTGSGKTAAFAMPILQKLQSAPAAWGVEVLALVPTRELALQVVAAFEALARFIPEPPRVMPIIGGEPVGEQIAMLSEGASIVVATPGRLLDLFMGGSIDLSGVHTLVLDEADRLLDAGFSEELAGLLAGLSRDRQTLLFSATLPQKVLDLSERVLDEPTVVRIDEAPTPIAGIQQRVYQVNRDQRRMLLQHLLRTESWGQTMVFVSTKRATENLSEKLRQSGFDATALHGDLKQADRIAALGRLRRGSVSVLVATDLAARGIDVQRLGAVVNFDLPRSPKGYIHRIGRTGRAGASGIAVSFVDHDSEAHFRLIEKRSQIRLPREQVPGFELTGAPQRRKKGAGGVKGRRRSKKDRLREQAAREKGPE